MSCRCEIALTNFGPAKLTVLTTVLSYPTELNDHFESNWRKEWKWRIWTTLYSLKEGAELVINHVMEYNAWAGQFALHSLWNNDGASNTPILIPGVGDICAAQAASSDEVRTLPASRSLWSKSNFELQPSLFECFFAPSIIIWDSAVIAVSV